MKINTVLPIHEQKNVITTLRKAYPVCILSCINEFEEWFNSKYIMVVGNIWEDGSSDFDIVDWCDSNNLYLSGKIREWFDVEYMEFAPEQTINEFELYIKETLTDNNYIIIFVDEYYITNSKNYLHRHYMHEYLIYGIEYLNKVCNVMGFDRRGDLKKINLSIKELYKGVMKFDPNKRIDYPLDFQLIKLKVRKKETIHFDFSQLLLQLDDYLSANCSDRTKDIITNSYKGKFYWGIDTYELFFHHIENANKGMEPFNFKLVHLFYEHKKGIRDRILWIETKLKITFYYSILYEKKVLSPLTNIRLVYLKRIISATHNMDNIWIKRMLSNIKKEEIQILNSLVEKIIELGC